ncbi:MAG TPA: glucose 1-dehydrogenase [Opitutaceae bacterium]|jgi:NAD(P)-dependent dehydrogenase (short-subunit alcohol dehydrogenase family)|nr:glucose 1-dehydrogenase [Opitutaceae bacterium]
MSGPALRLEGKGVLVTGSGTGIGREIGREFARCGAHVVFHYSQSAAGAVTASAEAVALGVRAHAVHADLAQMDEVGKLADEAERFLGRVDILVNNAGITLNQPFLKAQPQHFDKLYAVNVRAGFFLAQRLAPPMIAAGGGAICNLTSVHGFQGVPEHSMYAATKGAIIAYTRSLAVELAHRGVRVNAIAPGWVQVDNHQVANPGSTVQDAAAAAHDLIPAARFGLPEDVAKLAVFLCSDAAAFIIGQTIVIDGGTTALMSLVRDFRAESSARFGQRYV